MLSRMLDGGPNPLIIVRRARQSHYGQINNQSLGLFETQSGLYHFTKIKSEQDDYWFGVERYDTQGILKEYIRFSETSPDSLPLYASVLHRDASGLFYLLGVDSLGLSEIKQLRLESIPDFTHNSPCRRFLRIINVSCYDVCFSYFTDAACPAQPSGGFGGKRTP